MSEQEYGRLLWRRQRNAQYSRAYRKRVKESSEKYTLHREAARRRRKRYQEKKQLEKEVFLQGVLHPLPLKGNFKTQKRYR